MIRPTREQLQQLDPMGRIAFGVADAWNRFPFMKRAAHVFLRTVGAAWVHQCTKNVTEVIGLENLAKLNPDRGVILASNHRSFFDLYVVSSWMLRYSPWVERMYFPVRSNYWYERPDGILVNGIMSAWAMYPPVMRQADRKLFNEYTVDFLCDVARERGTVIGIHPEGRRNKTGNPYELLPAHPGIGTIVHRTQAIVVPAFVNGLINDIVRQIRGNFDGTAEPVRIVIGEPVDFTDLLTRPAKLRTYRDIAERVRVRISELGQIEKAIREGRARA